MQKWMNWGRDVLRAIQEVGLASVVRLQMELHPYLRAVPFLIAAVLVGVVAVLYSTAFTACVQVAKDLAQSHPYILLATSPLCFVTAAWLCVRFAPEAAGTGVPRVTRALELDPHTHGEEIERILSLRVCFIIALSSLVGILGTASLGREGPMVHMAACLFFCIGRFFQRLYPEFEHRSWIAAGGAAGVAAAFNAPMAGVVFALEELAAQHFHRFKTTVIWAAILGGVVAQSFSGRYLFFGYPRIGAVPLSSIPYAILVGLVCGMVAFPFHRMLAPDFQRWFTGFFRTKWRFALFLGLIVSALGAYLNQGVIGGGVQEVQALLFGNTRADWSLIGGRFLGTILSHLSGFAGGFLAPSLALGAALGSKIATLTEYASHNLLVMAGMAAFLSAVIRGPFTAWVIVMEMTDRHSAIFPLMVASLVSYGTVRLMVDKKKAADIMNP